MARQVKKSPLLGAVSSMIGEASGRLVTSQTQFRHSFELELGVVAADPDQPRRNFNDGDLAGLAATMAEQGQLQPILVRRDAADRRHWVIVAGERRWRAARLLGWTHILAIEHTGDAEVTALIENLQRVDLSPVEEARGLQRLIAEKGWSQDHAAAALGKAKSEVSASLRILSFPSGMLDRVLTSELPLPKNVLVEIARVEDAPQREALLESALTHGITVRGVREARVARLLPENPPPEEASPALRATRAVQRSVGLVRAARLRRGEVPADLLNELARLRDEIDLFLRRND
jgi:ParB family chromosome partitioning protein